jgi:succinylarginine dihydrolase
VVAVANERVLFAHEKAFADSDGTHAAITALMPDAEIVEVPDAEVPLADAIKSYLFNAQLVTAGDGAVTLIVPEEARETASVWAWIQRHVASNGAIRRVEVVDVRQSMANGGGPACLRLRVACDPSTVDPRFLVDEAKLDRIAATIAAHWPEEIAAGELQVPSLVADIEQARSALIESLSLGELA